MEFEKDFCPVVKVDGFIEKGKQFDLEINLPEDNRNVIYGVIKDCYKDPVEDAVVKLIEVCYEYGKEERKPVSHTFLLLLCLNYMRLYGDLHYILYNSLLLH